MEDQPLGLNQSFLLSQLDSWHTQSPSAAEPNWVLFFLLLMQHLCSQRFSLQNYCRSRERTPKEVFRITYHDLNWAEKQSTLWDELQLLGGHENPVSLHFPRETPPTKSKSDFDNSLSIINHKMCFCFLKIPYQNNSNVNDLKHHILKAI